MREQAAEVLFTDLGSDRERKLEDKILALLGATGLWDLDLAGRLAALKIHFGERGNTAYIKPVYVAPVVERLREKGARPFLTDSNTLYSGSRGDSVSHWWTAVRNGFDPAAVGAPVIISGGLRGTDGRPVAVPGKHFRQVQIVPEVLEADLVVGLTHFKGHEMSGFGGTLKNFGMGCASRGGKLAMHSRGTPFVKAESCAGCGRCLPWCGQAALAMVDGRARIDTALCAGCGACIPVCPEGAIRLSWDEAPSDMQEKMVEHAVGALSRHLPGNAFFLNFIMQVSPLCDCYPFAGSPLVPDLGVAASRDPVALDQASADLVNRARGLESDSLPEAGRPAGADKFRAVHPGADWGVQLAHAEALGLGRRAYRLTVI